MIPITLVRRLLRLLATRLDSYPRSSITAWTRSRVSGAVPYRPLTTRETVAIDTPASAATSPIVTLSRARFTLDLPHSVSVIENVYNLGGEAWGCGEK